MEHETVTDNGNIELYLFCADNYETDSSEKLVRCASDASNIIYLFSCLLCNTNIHFS